jgi:hypothetical protein
MSGQLSGIGELHESATVEYADSLSQHDRVIE